MTPTPHGQSPHLKDEYYSRVRAAVSVFFGQPLDDERWSVVRKQFEVVSALGSLEEAHFIVSVAHAESYKGLPNELEARVRDVFQKLLTRVLTVFVLFALLVSVGCLFLGWDAGSSVVDESIISIRLRDASRFRSTVGAAFADLRSGLEISAARRELDALKLQTLLSQCEQQCREETEVRLDKSEFSRRNRSIGIVLLCLAIVLLVHYVVAHRKSRS